MMNSLFLQAIF
ncbi:hypothetical protein E5E99_00185 [Dichelobacter nodosus]|nr:hypothetical protein DYQ38_04080 [Dichelobacter nodosus]TGA66920.1 hypothetical protein E5E99_00185 [Dichelobacter nodosus]